MWANGLCSIASVLSDSLWPMDCRRQGSSVHGMLQARILEWVAVPSSRGASKPRNQTHYFWHLLCCRHLLYQWTKWDESTDGKQVCKTLSQVRVCSHNQVQVLKWLCLILLIRIKFTPKSHKYNFIRTWI